MRAAVLAAAGIAVVILSTSLLPGSPVGTRGVSLVSTPPTSGDGDGINEASSAPQNATDCGLVNVQTLNVEGWQSIEPNVSAIFAKLCVLPAFENLLLQWGGWYYVAPVTANGTTTPGHWAGPSNFSWGGSGTIGHPLSIVSFGLDWLAWANTSVRTSDGCSLCGFQEDWIGYIWNNTLVGPFVRTYQPVIAGGPGLQSTGTRSTSDDWIVLAGLAAGLASAGVSMVKARRQRSMKSGPGGPPPGESEGLPPARIAGISGPPTRTDTGDAPRVDP